MGIVTAGLQRATPGARKEATLFCGNWGLTGRTCGILLPAAEGDRLRPRLRGVEGDVDVLENVARGNGHHAVGFDEVVAAFACLLAAEGVDETERRGENASAHGEASAVGLPVVGLVEVAAGVAGVVRNFLFVLEHSWFTGEGASGANFSNSCR